MSPILEPTQFEIVFLFPLCVLCKRWYVKLRVRQRLASLSDNSSFSVSETRCFIMQQSSNPHFQSESQFSKAVGFFKCFLKELYADTAH